MNVEPDRIRILGRSMDPYSVQREVWANNIMHVALAKFNNVIHNVVMT